MRDAAGNTALHKAAECSQPTACRFLIANGADPLIKNCEGRVPADLATASVAKVIMEEPIKPNADIESQLLEAAKNGDLDTVKVRGERESTKERERERVDGGKGEIATLYLSLCSICVHHKTSTLVTSVGVSLPRSTLLLGLIESALWSTSCRMVLMSMPGTRGELTLHTTS